MIFQCLGRIAPVLERHTKLIVRAREVITNVGIVTLFSCQLLIERTCLPQIVEPARRVGGVLELGADFHVAVGQAESIIHVARIRGYQCFANSECLVITIERAGHVADACAIDFATYVAHSLVRGGQLAL